MPFHITYDNLNSRSRYSDGLQKVSMNQSAMIHIAQEYRADNPLRQHLDEYCLKKKNSESILGVPTFLKIIFVIKYI